MTITTRATVSISSNSTSFTEARMVMVRSVRTFTLIAAGRLDCKLRQQLLDAVDDGDDVGAGLALNVDDDRRLAVHPCGLLRILRRIHDRRNIRSADGGAVAIGDDDRLVVVAGEKLVVGVDGERLAHAVQRALGLVDVRRGNGRAQIFKAQVVGRKLRGIRLDAHRGLLSARDRNQAQRP